MSSLDIITVTKDDLDGVAATIQSTRNLRSFPGVRQIIIDSSKKQTQNDLKKIVAEEKAVEYLWQEPRGIGAAFNEGLSKSTAQWVWFLNGRDQVHPALEPAHFLYLLRASKADSIIFELEYMQSGTRYVHPSLWGVWPPVLFWIPHPSTIVSRDLFNKYGYFIEEFKIAMDGEIWFRFFSKVVVVDMLSIPIALYDEGGISIVQKSETAKEGLKIIRRYFLKILKMWIVNGKTIYKAYKHYWKMSRSG